MSKVFIGGATGWTGSALSIAVNKKQGMKLVGGLSKASSGKNLADILPLGEANIPLFKSVEEALEKIEFDILVEFTHPEVAKKNVLAALQRGKNVVIGTSGLTEGDFEEIDTVAKQNDCAVLAAGNFALTAVLLQKFATMAAKYINNYEIIDYASNKKVDAPSGSVSELAYRLAQVRQPNTELPKEQVIGMKEARGGVYSGIHIHSVRLPGHVLGIETIFGLNDEKLILRHDAGSSADPYINGVLLAITKINSFKGLRRGLDTIMDFDF